MDGEFLKWSVGQGGLAIAFMVLFHFYRQDVKRYTDSWKDQSNALLTVVKENTASNTRLVASTDSMQALIAQLMQIVGQRGDVRNRRFGDPPDPSSK